MSKAKTDTENPAAPELETSVSASAFVAAGTFTFRDGVFTSRTLVLPGGKTLAVAKGLVTVEEADAEALAFLKAHDEFSPLE